MTARCLETRTRFKHMRVRRYEAADGTRYSTYELPATVVKAVGMGRVKEALQTYERGRLQRARAAQLRQRVLSLVGVKATAVAHELGVTEVRVRQIRKGAV